MKFWNGCDLLTYTRPSDEEQAFLKIRVNYYQRVTHGLWSCTNDKCDKKDDGLKIGALVRYMRHIKKNVIVGLLY